VVRGAEDAAAASGRSVLLCNSAEDPDREVGYLDALEDQRIEALIVASSGVWERQRERLLAFRCPVVLLHQPSDDPSLSSVSSDDDEGGRLAAQHLLDRGYERLVYIGGPPDAPTSSDRYRSAVAAAGGAYIEQITTDGHVQQGHAAMIEFAQRSEPPFGVLAHNDLTAIGVLSALAEIGWAVPDEVGVVGYDDLEFTPFVQPPLTTVRQDKYVMGSEAVRLALQLLDDDTVPQQVIIPTTLVERRSTRQAPPAAPAR
jgi:LacI family transcriptional regulator